MDLRKRRSQEKLQIALAHHLQDKTIDEITIGELTATAGVSRQTFYSNFDSKQSILLSRIEALFERSRDNFESLMKRDDLPRYDINSLGMRYLLEEVIKDKHMMRAAFTGQAGIQCLSLLKKHLSEVISERILQQFNHNLDADQLDLISDFYGGALIGTIQGWLLSDGQSRSLDDLTLQVAKMLIHGLDSYVTD